ATGRPRGVVRVADGPRVAGVAAAGEAEVLADGLAQDRAAGVEDARDHGGVDLRRVALEHAGAVHHRDSGHADVVLDGHRLAREQAPGRALDLSPPVPGA